MFYACRHNLPCNSQYMSNNCSKLFQVVSFDGSTTIEELVQSLTKKLSMRDSSQSGFALFTDDPGLYDGEHYLQSHIKVSHFISCLVLMMFKWVLGKKLYFIILINSILFIDASEIPRLWLRQSLPSLFSPTCRKAKFRKKNSINSNKFLHNFHLLESSFTCHGLWASDLDPRNSLV